MADVIKKFDNNVVLAGKLAELDEVREADDKNGKHYISVKGAIQCGESTTLIRNFECFIYEKTKKNEDSKAYTNMKSWLKNAVPMTKNAESPTMVEMVGNMKDGAYVNASEELKETVKYSMSLVNPFTEYRCDITLEGYVKNVSPEMRDDKETGRLKVELVSMDFSKNVMDIKNIIVPKEVVDGFSACGYEDGVLGKLYLSYVPHEDKAPTKGGFGKKMTAGKSYSELTVVGAEDAVEIADEGGSDTVLDRDGVKNMLSVRKEYINELKEKGYQGSKKESSVASSGKSFAKKNSKAKKVEEDEDEDEDDLPF